MSRIDDRFLELRREGRTGLVTYVTAGDPSLSISAEVIAALDRGGADLIEIGVPFSDPLADGPVIQRASERAIASGTTLGRTLDLIEQQRVRVRAPIVLFSYANPIVRMGLAAFAARAARAAVDGVVVLDWPPEEGHDLLTEVKAAGIDMVYLVSPTTSPERIRMVAERGSGFLYAISRLGVTGAKRELAPGVGELVSRIRAVSALPVAVGFGVSRPEHVRDIGKVADAAVVGSALVQLIAEASTAPDLAERVRRHVEWLKTGCGRSL